MKLCTILRRGGRIRHRDWSPFRFAELRLQPNGRTSLCRVAPTGDVVPIDVSLDELQEGDCWSVLAVRSSMDEDC